MDEIKQAFTGFAARRIVAGAAPQPLGSFLLAFIDYQQREAVAIEERGKAAS